MRHGLTSRLPLLVAAFVALIAVSAVAANAIGSTASEGSLGSYGYDWLLTRVHVDGPPLGADR